MKLGDWVQVVSDEIPDEDDGPVVAVRGDIGHVLQEETRECWAMVFFERTGCTTGVPPSDVEVLCSADLGRSETR